MFITSFGEQNITYKCCSNFLIHLLLPYKEISPKIHVRDLKNYTHKGYIDKLGHIGSWGERFDQRLAEIGIFANLRETNKYSSINRKNY